MNYEVLIVDNKTDNDDIKNKVDNNWFIGNNNNNNNNNKEMETISLDNNGENSLNNTNIDSNNILNDSSSEQVVTYNGSDNNYLSSLSITNYDLSSDFSKDRLTYFVTVDSDITSLEINATSENSSSIVSINGNEDLSDGTNKILITVTAENGNTKNYRIYVIKEN
jgi:hypothetical protein